MACWAMPRARTWNKWRWAWERKCAANSILWDKVSGRREPVIAIHQRLLGEDLGEEDGVMLIDELSMVKQGRELVGVAAQYCGSVGKIANGQVGVYLGYASCKGYSLIECQLFMPDKWFEKEHAERRKACGVPEDLAFKTKPEIGLELLESAEKRGHLCFSWVAADALYGSAPAFRDGVAAIGKWYFTAIKEDTPIWCRPPQGSSSAMEWSRAPSQPLTSERPEETSAASQTIGEEDLKSRLVSSRDQRRQQRSHRL